jgi:hypothetical protein
MSRSPLFFMFTRPGSSYQPPRRSTTRGGRKTQTLGSWPRHSNYGARSLACSLELAATNLPLAVLVLKLRGGWPDRCCRRPGYLPEARARCIGKVFRVPCNRGAIRFPGFQMAKRGHGQQSVPEFNRPRSDAVSLAITPNKAHDLIDEIRICRPRNHHLIILAHNTP